MSPIPFPTGSSNAQVPYSAGALREGYLNEIISGPRPALADGCRITAEDLASHQITAQEAYAALMGKLTIKHLLDPKDPFVASLATALRAPTIPAMQAALKPLGVELPITEHDTHFARTFQTRSPRERAYGVVQSQAAEIPQGFSFGDGKKPFLM